MQLFRCRGKGTLSINGIKDLQRFQGELCHSDILMNMIERFRFI